MTLPEITIDFDLHQLLGGDFDAARVMAWVTTNIPNQTLMDTSTGETRLGEQRVTVGADGTGSFTLWAVGPDGNPASWQTYFHVEYPLDAKGGRWTRRFGPYTLEAAHDGANLADLEDEQAIPPTYLTLVTEQLDAYVDEAGDARDGAVVARAGAEVARAGAEAARDQATEIALGDAEAALAGYLASQDLPANGDALNSGFWARTNDPRTYPGVDPTGVVECGTELQAALDAIYADPDLDAPKSLDTFKIDTLVKVKGDADLWGATFNCSGAGGIQLGDGGSGVLLRHKRIDIGTIIDTSKPGTGWTAATTGLKAVNTQECNITVREIQGFETGYYAYGLGGGNSYNKVRIGHLNNNKRNLVRGAGTGGWSNQNVYDIGSLSHNSGEGTNVAGTRQILIENSANLGNGDKFNGGSVEGDVAEYELDCDGYENIFDGIRWENTGGGKVIWRANADRNVIRGGYGAHLLVETHVAGSSLNRIESTGTTHMNGSSDSAVVVFENRAGADLGAFAVMDPGAREDGSDPATDYRMLPTANATYIKRAADAYPRMKIDHDNGRIYYGNGTAAPTAYMGNLNSNDTFEFNGGHLAIRPDATYDFGYAGFRFRDGAFSRDLAVGRHLEIDGDLNHDGTTVGFFGATPTTKPTALTAAAPAAPAGGTGTAAGGWSTAADRNTAITTINTMRTRLGELEAKLQALGLIT